MSYRFVLLGLVALAWVPGVILAMNVLVGTGAVYPNQYLKSVSGQYALLLRPDCNLVMYNFSKPLLATNISESPVRTCALWMQQDGNLVVYNFTDGYEISSKREPKWSQGYSNTSDGSNSFLLLGDDGSFNYFDTDVTARPPPLNTLYNSASPFLNVSAYPPKQFVWDVPTFDASDPTYTAWTPNASLAEIPYLPAEYFISAGNRLLTRTKVYALELGSDCNLQLTQRYYSGGQYPGPPLWESATNTTDNRTTCKLTLLRNGTLQISDINSGTILWNNTNNGNGVAGSNVSWVLRVNPDNGSLSVSDIMNSSRILWTNNADMKPADSPNYNPDKNPAASPIYNPDKNPAAKPIYKWIAVGAALVLALAILGLYFCVRERFLDPSEKAFQARLRANGGNSRVLSQAKIKKATRNYSNMIGRGGFGDVFYGKLSDGQEVAAKVLSARSHQSKTEFYNEIELLSMVHHKYLVSLLGHSCTRKHQILIYEYMAGGDLRHRLQGESSAENPLSWQQRTTIILQVAEGLEYLHDKCSPPIIHRDVKSTNILLTDKLVAKVADFGLSKLKLVGYEDATHVTTVVKGTPGYLDPEYHETGMLTEKSDVYAFGVVLMEVLTGRNHMSIAQKVGEAWRQEQCDGLADPSLGDDFDRGQLVSLVELALWCVRRSSAERPFMPQVLRRLHDLGLGASCEPFQPDIELGEEDKIHLMNIQLSTLGSDAFSSDIEPLSAASSSRMHSKIHHHSTQIC